MARDHGFVSLEQSGHAHADRTYRRHCKKEAARHAVRFPTGLIARDRDGCTISIDSKGGVTDRTLFDDISQCGAGCSWASRWLFGFPGDFGKFIGCAMHVLTQLAHLRRHALRHQMIRACPIHHGVHRFSLSGWPARCCSLRIHSKFRIGNVCRPGVLSLGKGFCNVCQRFEMIPHVGQKLRLDFIRIIDFLARVGRISPGIAGGQDGCKA